jgi:O-antigen ligase
MGASSSSRLLAAFVLVAIPWLDPFSSGPSPSVQPWLVSMACALGLWGLAVSGEATGRLRLLWPAIAIVAWAALSQMTLRPETLMLAGGLALIAVVAGSVEDEAVTRALQAGCLFAAVTSAVIGLLQYFGLSPQFSPWVNITEAGEAYANLRQPNLYATLCWIGAGVVLFGTLRLPFLAAGILMAILAAGSAASVSRTGMLQGLVLTTLAAIWSGPGRRRRLTLCGIAALAYFAATLLLPLLLAAANGALPARTLWGRIGGGASCSSRLVLWSNVLHLIAQKPLTGWGWGELDYAHFMTLYPGARFCDILDNAHNLPLHLAVELGVPAAVAICGGGLWWAWRQQPWQEESALRRLAWALLAIVLLHSLLEYPLWYGPFQIVFGAALGWLTTREGNRMHDTGAVHARAAVAVLVLLVGTAYAAWDYTRVSQIYLVPEQRRAMWRDDTLAEVRRSWLFSGQAQFADLTLSTVTSTNAAPMYRLSQEVLHYSPEPRVAERLIESATQLGLRDEAARDLARYRAAFPRDYENWRGAQQLPGLRP